MRTDIMNVDDMNSKKKKNKIMKKINKKIIHHHKILKMIHIINGKNIWKK
jgi:hypothetical protein